MAKVFKAIRLVLRAAPCIVLFMAASSAVADVVELKSGERLQGKFLRAAPAGVVIDIGGESISMPLAKVRAIYFGDGPGTTATQISPAREALQALEALRSVTTSGLSFREYAPRVLDAKVKVDQYLTSPAQGHLELRAAIGSAMRYYEVASRAWNLKIGGIGATGFPAAIEAGRAVREELGACAAIKKFLADADPNMRGRPGGSGVISDADWRAALTASFIGQQPAILWNCASAKVTEAKALLNPQSESAPRIESPPQGTSMPKAAAKPALPVETQTPTDPKPSESRPGDTTVVKLP